MMVDFLGEKDASEMIRVAVEAAAKSGLALTPDVGGDADTASATQAILDSLGS